jgi:glutamine transport system substrate-binding protein
MKKAVVLLLAVALMLSLAACGGGQEAAPDNNGAADTEKTYVVGTDAAYPPFEKLDGEKITGFDIDILNAIAEAVGIKVDVQNTGWDPLFDGIDKGKVDFGISAITITEDRKEKYDFSDPYFEATQLIMVSEDSPVTQLADLQGKKIGVQTATTGETAVRKAFGDTYEGIKGYDDTPSAVDDLFNGRVDAVVADNAVLQEYLKKFPDKKIKLIKDESFEVEQYGLMVKKGNAELLAKINEGLKIIKENGTYEKIFNNYFGQ